MIPPNGRRRRGRNSDVGAKQLAAVGVALAHWRMDVNAAFASTRRCQRWQLEIHRFHAQHIELGRSLAEYLADAK
jgi:hypothetical protein